MATTPMMVAIADHTAGLLRLRLSAEAMEHVREGSATLGISASEYCRVVLERDAVADPDARFLDHLRAWWGYRGQGDVTQIDGAARRAAGQRIAFAHKLRMAIRQMFEHGLL